MATEAISKLQPNRTISLKGFDRRGAAAALHSATATSFKVSGVFRDFADFSVVDLWDADNHYEHYSMRYLPDFDFSGMGLTFDLKYNGQLQPIESPKNTWISWHGLSCTKVNTDGSETGCVIPFWENATLQAGSFTPASETWNVYGTAASGDKIAWYYLNIPFEIVWGNMTVFYQFFWQNSATYEHYITITGPDEIEHRYGLLEGTGNGTDAASSIAYQINNDSSCPLEAVWDATNGVTLKPKTFDGLYYDIAASDGNGTAQIHNADTTPESIVTEIARQINSYDWAAEQPALSIIASAAVANLTIKAGRYGTVSVAGTTVTWLSGDRFPGIEPFSFIYLNGKKCRVSQVDSPTMLTLEAPPTGLTGTIQYLAERGGTDGNMIQIQQRSIGGIAATGNALMNTQIRQCNKKLTGGSSNVTWRININFSNSQVAVATDGSGTRMAADKLRKLWLTLAPMLTDTAYDDTEFTVDITNWSVTDPSSKRPLKVAGPGSVRVGSRDDWAKYDGAWSEWVTNVTPGSNFYYGGAAHATGATGAMVRLKYSCQSTHDLYLGTDLYTDRGIVTTTVDGTAANTIDTYLNTDAPVTARRLIKASVPAGEHVVVITNSAAKNAASAGWNFIFDYLEAAVKSDVPDPVEVVTDVSPAIDWDTDHTYKLPPDRLVWNLDRLGMRGDINEYIGVFWWNQRKRASGTNRAWNITLGGTWATGDRLAVTISGITVRKTVHNLDQGDGNTATMKVVAQSIVDRINTTFVGVWAERTGASNNVITVHPRTAMFWFTKSVSVEIGSGTVSETGSLDPGSEGVWEVDLTASVPLNKAARDWHTDLFSKVQAKGWSMVLAYSMELLNPPEDPTAGRHFAARYGNGIQVLTATGFGTEAAASITGASNASPIVITAEGHGYNSGDSININGVAGNTAANGTWTITRLNADTFSLDGSTGNGAFTAWTATSGAAVPTSVRNLRTTHCTFSSNMTNYQKEVYKYTAGLMATAGLTPWLQFGEFLWWFFSYGAKNVTGASNASPVAITCAGHGLTTGQRVIITGVQGNEGANGTWPVTVTGTNTFTLNGSSGTGTYVAATGSVRGWGMAYYDGATTAAATASLGRALAQFDTQDDDPTVNSSADANFLAARLKAHVDTIRSYVLASYSSAKFEWLHALDVNGPVCYHTLDFPYPQGGRLNHAVNIPSAWKTKTGSGLDRMKMEALSWGATYRNLDKAKETIKWPYTAPQGWPKADSRYLIPIFNGGCPWEQEYLFCRKEGLPHINFWAWDHISLLSVPLPLPKNKGDARLT